MSENCRGPESSESVDPTRASQLLPLVYDELHNLATARMAGEQPGHILQATALVHEAWIKLTGSQGETMHWNDRRHFFAAAGEAMRRILIDHARRKATDRRGGGWQQITLGNCSAPRTVSVAEFIDLNNALGRFEATHPEKAEVATLRLLAGLTTAEIAAALNLGSATVKRHWAFAKAWLSRELRRGENYEENS